MSKRNKYMTGIVIGLSIFFVGWAIRSTFIMHNLSNKPVGGILMAAGMLTIGLFAYKLLKR